MISRMSPGELRRYLLVLVMLGCVFVCYMFWIQPTNPAVAFSAYTNPAKKFYEPYKKADMRWSWDCVNQRCVRKEVQESHPHTSLATCSMLCGSTQLWPQPTGPVNLGSRSVVFNHRQLEFETKTPEPALAYLQHSFAVFNSNVVALVQRPDVSTNSKSDITTFVVKVSIEDSSVVRLLLSTDESYKLVVRPEGEGLIATVVAKNFFGARHGLETLSQLIWWDEFAGSGMLRVVRGASVQDAPRFAYRGLMVDTARNFVPLDTLKGVLIGMAANKLNVFHWHVSDSQSFPLELPRVPLLAKHGAYGPDMVYAVDQVKELVAFARVRGIRVVLEVDVPAHAGNGWTWGPEEGLGDLAVCVNMQPWSLYCGEPPCGQLNPDNPKVYDVLEKIFADIIDLTGEDEIFHLGGDEVNLECWSNYRNRNTTAFINVDYNEVWGNFTLEALKRLEKANGGKRPKAVVLWSSNLTKRPYSVKYLNRDSIVVQAWGGSEWSETPELVTAGYKIIVSHVDAWYLDCGFGRWRERGEAACDPYRTWQTVYNHQPWGGDTLYRQQVLGGEACLWSEQVDAKSVDTRLWPRAAAYAERVWNDPNSEQPLSINEDVYTRLSTHRDRLLSRGLSAEALWPQWCSQNPGMCL